MGTEGGISRRRVLSLAIAAGGLVMAGGARVASAQASGRTPDQILGPFYPVAKPLYQGADLTSIPGRPGPAAGQVIHLMGRVLNRKGQPVQGARIEVWQAMPAVATRTRATSILRRSIPISKGSPS